MIIISHRGKLSSQEEKLAENNPERVRELLSNYGVEIDLWVENGYLYLSHDPEISGYIVNEKFLQQANLWIHCKNITALEFCKDWNLRHYFFHDKDDATLTSSGYIWTFPKSSIPLTKYSIPVVYNRHSKLWNYEELKQCFAICTDEPEFFNELFNGRQEAV